MDCVADKCTWDSCSERGECKASQLGDLKFDTAPLTQNFQGMTDREHARINHEKNLEATISDGAELYIGD